MSETITEALKSKIYPGDPFAYHIVGNIGRCKFSYKLPEEIVVFLFLCVPAKCHAPLLLVYEYFVFDGERILHLQGHLTMAESSLVAVQ